MGLRQYILQRGARNIMVNAVGIEPGTRIFLTKDYLPTKAKEPNLHS